MDDRLLKIIVSHMNDKSIKVTDDSNLVSDLGMDSLDIVEICMELETIINVHFSEDDISKVHYVKDLYDLYP